MSKVVRIYQPGGPDVMRLEDVEVGAPGPGEVRLAVEAIGLNRAEAIFRQGAYLQPPKFPPSSAMKGSG